jgi:5'-deoxynucleotidase YfbR-like HD superfamily hydrolase
MTPASRRPPDPRWAMQVTRYHTWPRLREQSVGEHSMQVMRILLAIWPKAPRELLIHCMVHDIGEVWSGDPPYPVKAQNPDMKEACDRVEGEAHIAMCLPWGVPPPAVLSQEERAVFKLAEFIEMMEWGLYEAALGNTMARLVVTRCREASGRLMEQVPEDICVAATKYILKRESEYAE